MLIFFNHDRLKNATRQLEERLTDRFSPEETEIDPGARSLMPRLWNRIDDIQLLAISITDKHILSSLETLRRDLWTRAVPNRQINI